VFYDPELGEEPGDEREDVAAVLAVYAGRLAVLTLDGQDVR
jgi:hypothetical protein